MKLYALLVYDEKQKLVYKNYNLEDFLIFYRPKIKETIEEFSREIIKNVKKDSRYKINQKNEDFDIVIYGSTFSKYYIAITDPKYPQRTAFTLINTINTIKNTADLDNLFETYQNPQTTDKVSLIQQEMDDVKVILLDSIEKLLERGESMDDLLNRTYELNIDSDIFKRKAKDLNSCCVIF